MNIKAHVTSRELSEKLKALGVPQVSQFWWVAHNFRDGKETTWRIFDQDGYYADKQNEAVIDRASAFLASEIGELLWEAGAENFIKAYGEVFNFKGTGMVGTLGVMNLMRKPDMGAKMLIYLIENGLIQITK